MTKEEEERMQTLSEKEVNRGLSFLERKELNRLWSVYFEDGRVRK